MLPCLCKAGSVDRRPTAAAVGQIADIIYYFKNQASVGRTPDLL